MTAAPLAFVRARPWPALAAALVAFAAGWRVAGAAGALAAFVALAAGLAVAGRGRVSERRFQPSQVGLALADITAEVGLGFGTVERDRRLVHANPVLLDLLGAGPGAVGRPLVELVAPEDRPALDALMAAAFEGAAPAREMRVRLAARPADAALLLIGYTRRFDRLFVSCKDDSRQLRLEAQVLQATKMQAVGQLAGGIAHDFNNILTAIIGTTELMLMRHGAGSADHQDLSQIAQNANRAANLVRQLLAFSRQQTLRTRVLRLPDVLGEVAHLLQRLLGERIRLRVGHAPDLACVRADPGQLEQVIVNLAVNARDAMPDGGDLTISTYSVAASEVGALGHRVMPPGDYVAIAVRDTGEGIPREIIGQVFDPFFTTKAVGKGTGLGLSMAYGIVKQTGGYIFVDSAPGLGTTFNIYLPAVAEAPAAEPAAPRPPAAAWGQGTILVVEDEAMVRAVAARALARSGYEVLTAASGEEALALLERREAIDLLISDVVMPGMDGPALVERARAARPDLRVLFISGYAEEQLRDRLDATPAQLLKKPFSVHELSEAVRTRLAA